MSMPIPKPRSDACFQCGSRKCYTRIWTESSPLFDEVACPDHGRDLERHADAALPIGHLRTHRASTERQRRSRR